MESDGGERTHGGTDLSELRSLGLAPDEILDFSVNVNPYGPTTFMRDAIRNAAIERYPDPHAIHARDALAAVWQVDLSCVVLGAGAAELLWAITRAMIRPGDHVVVAGPTFSEVGFAAAAAGATVHEVRASENSFRLDPKRLLRAIVASEARLVYLCTPNNPTGQAWPVAQTVDLARQCADTLFIVDESFLSLSEQHGDAFERLPDNTIRIRSLTKDHGIPGARVGAAIATPGLVRRIEATRPAWSTGAITQAAATAAAAEQGFVAESRSLLLDDRVALSEGLRMIGLSPLPSRTIFVLVPVGDARCLRTRLLSEDKILVRDCSSFGLPGYLRIAARPAPQSARLLSALRTHMDWLDGSDSANG
jgi:histidinol-phosphate/aromatic aminotransferase/cobyric acid decarboxylase-like protein